MVVISFSVWHVLLNVLYHISIMQIWTIFMLRNSISYTIVSSWFIYLSKSLFGSVKQFLNSAFLKHVINSGQYKYVEWNYSWFSRLKPFSPFRSFKNLNSVCFPHLPVLLWSHRVLYNRLVTGARKSLAEVFPQNKLHHPEKSPYAAKLFSSGCTIHSIFSKEKWISSVPLPINERRD